MNEKKKYFLSELRKMGVSTNAKNVPIDQLDYESLKSLLSVKRAVAN